VGRFKRLPRPNKAIELLMFKDSKLPFHGRSKEAIRPKVFRGL
jgi:hypothetical protein